MRTYISWPDLQLSSLNIYFKMAWCCTESDRGREKGHACLDVLLLRRYIKKQRTWTFTRHTVQNGITMETTWKSSWCFKWSGFCPVCTKCGWSVQIWKTIYVKVQFNKIKRRTLSGNTQTQTGDCTTGLLKQLSPVCRSVRTDQVVSPEQ